MTEVRGRVLDHAGVGVPGAWVSARRPTDRHDVGTHTRADGTWSLFLEPGLWAIREHGGRDHGQVRVGAQRVELGPREPTATADAAGAADADSGPDAVGGALAALDAMLGRREAVGTGEGPEQ